jgi:tellurite methyltransferase
VLDVAAGVGRHALPAAAGGAHVVAVDSDKAKLKDGRKAAEKAGLVVEWAQADLTVYPIPPKSFDVVMIFNYLDRRRMPDFLEAVRPGGYLLFETFLEGQRQYGWGPKSDDHLLRSGELLGLIGSSEIVLAREVIEVVAARPMAVASVLALRPGK